MSSCSLLGENCRAACPTCLQKLLQSPHISPGTHEGKLFRMLATLLPRTNWSEWNDATVITEKNIKITRDKAWGREWWKRSSFCCIYPDIASKQSLLLSYSTLFLESYRFPDESRLCNCIEHSHTYIKYSYLSSHILEQNLIYLRMS